MTTFANEGSAISAETIHGNVDITTIYNKNSIVQLPVPAPITDHQRNVKRRRLWRDRTRMRMTAGFHGREIERNTYHINFRVVQPDSNFTGRSNELDKLKQLSASTDAEKIVVAGMGGVGKTQLTRKFIEMNQTNYENIIWIDAETENGIGASFKKLSEDTLHLSTLNANGKDKDSKSIIEQVLQILCEKKTLFVYDNVDSIQSMKFVLAIAPAPQRVKPHVLITSRRRQWCTGITVIVLTVEAVKFISEILDDPNDPHNDSDDHKMLLAETLQYFPLALRQATTYIKQQREYGDFKISKYIDKFKLNISEMLQTTAFQDDFTNDYNNTTYTTWSITIRAIEKDEVNGQLAMKIFKIIAYFEPELIERDCFAYLTFNDDDEDQDERIKTAVALLVRYCMVESHDKQQVLEVHRLVQQVTKYKLKESHEEESVLRDALQLISNIDVKHSLVVMGPHIISVFRSALSYPDLIKNFSSLSLQILDNILFFISEKVKPFGDTVLEPLTNILGENDRVLLKFRYYIARSYRETGLRDQALQMFIDILEKQTTNFGECDADTLQTQCEIANLYHWYGNANASIQLYEKVLGIQKQCLGEDHPDTIKTKSALAFHSNIEGELSFITAFMKREGLL